MKFGRRTVYALMLGLVALNLLVRFPRTEHETGVDSFFIHNLAPAITEHGRAAWILNPLGYFGWYPLSYPGSGPFLISGLTQVAGVTGEGSILALSLLYGVLGPLVAFLMARAFRQDDLFALSTALIFSLAPRFMSFTLWSASTRNLFMVLIPVFLWALVRSYRRPTRSNLVVLISSLVVMLATHRLTILLAVIVLAFVMAYVFILLHGVSRVRFPRLLLSRSVRKWTPRLALIAIAGIAGFMLFGTEVLKEYSAGEICSGESLPDQVCNLGVSITRSVGLVLPFVILGVLALVREYNKGFIEAFLVFSLLALIPTLFLRQYTGFYILPFLALFGAFGVVGLLRALRKYPRMGKAVVVASVVAISGFSIGILEIEVDRTTSVSSGTYSTALYLASLPGGNFVANEGLMGVRVAAISGRSVLPVGGAGTTSQSPELLVMGLYEPSEIFAREDRIPLGELTIEDDSPFRVEGIDSLLDWQVRILFLRADQVANRTIEEHALVYYVELEDFRGAYSAFGNTYRGDPFSNFALSCQATRYKIYDGSSEDIFYAFGPRG